MSDDLSADALAAAMPGRPIRSYRAVLSTESVALAWAREGAPHGALVVAGYQASPRGRAGWPWPLTVERGLAFSLVLRPTVPAAREGWIYVAANCGIADLCGAGALIAWPDEVYANDRRVGAVGTWAELGQHNIQWAVLNVLLPEATAPRTDLLARAVDAIVTRMDSAAAEQVLAEYRARCRTLGRRVMARMIPMGPAGPRVEGRAVDVLSDGSLVLSTDRGTRVAVRPQNLGVLDEVTTEAATD